MAGEGKGWISIYRSMQDHWLWQEKPFSKGQAWLDLLLSANHKENKFLLGNEILQVDRGSFVTSELKLMEKWGWSKSKVRSFLNLLKNDNMITKTSDKKKTTITIVNYELYQDSETTKEPQKDHARTTKEPCKDTNNNDNNVNNENNDNKRESTHSSQSINLIKYYSELLPGQDISAHMATLNVWIEMYSYEWTKEAIQKCISNKNKFIKPYIEMVLKNWARDGKEENYGGTRQDNGESKKPQYDFNKPYTGPRYEGEIDF